MQVCIQSIYLSHLNNICAKHEMNNWVIAPQTIWKINRWLVFVEKFIWKKKSRYLILNGKRPKGLVYTIYTSK